MRTMTPISSRRALAAGLAAYLLWGVFPPYFALMKPATPLEILAHRVVWSFVVVGLALVVSRAGWAWVRADVFTKERFPRLLLATVLIAVNWLTYIWAVNSGHVVPASLGYFINPLVSLLFGVLFFGEKLGRGGRIGVPIAFLGVLVISWGHWDTVWISLLLALSFASYSVMKKSSHLGGLQGLLVESGLLAPAAVVYLVFLAVTGTGRFGASPGATAILFSAGIATAVPLWLFAVAASNLKLGVVGVLQYVTPTMQFLFGILLFGEEVTPTYWAGLVLIWIGSAIYLTLTLRAHRRVEALPADS